MTMIMFQGCATLPEKAPNEIVPLHSSPMPTWGGIKASGMAEDCDYTPFFSMATPKGKVNFFSKTDKKATWWALFQPSALGFRTTVPGFVARWYAPNGNLYWEENFAGDIG